MPQRQHIGRVMIALAIVGATVATVPAAKAAPPTNATPVDSAAPSGATTAQNFVAGATYRLIASGGYTNTVGTVATSGDANCYGGLPDPIHQLQVFAGNQPLALQWRSWMTVGASGCDPSSLYYADVTGTGGPLTYRFAQTVGNSGTLTVLSWRSNGACAAPLPDPEPWWGSGLYGQTAFADSVATSATIIYGDGLTRTVALNEKLAAGCSAQNHSFNNAIWACNTRYPQDDPSDISRAGLFSGELASGQWIADSFNNTTRVPPNAYPSQWWQGSGHGGFRTCNIAVAGAVYKITVKGDYQWEARLRPGELGDAMCSTPSATAVAFDPTLGGVYVADQGLDTISTVLGSGKVTRDAVAAAPDTHPGAAHLYPSAPGLAVNPATHLLYAADEGSPFNGTDAVAGVESEGGVHVVDLATNAVTSISLGEPQYARLQNLTALAVDTQRNRVYAANNLLGALFVIDGDRVSATFNTVIASVPLGGVGATNFVAVDQALARVYVTSAQDRTVKVIDETDNSIVDTFALGHVPGDVAVDPSTHLLYVVDADNGALDVVDPRSHSATPVSIPVPRTVPAIAPQVMGIGVLAASGGVPAHVYLAVLANGVDANTHGMANNDPAAPFARGDGQVVVIDPAARSVVATFARPAGGTVAGPDPERVAVDPVRRLVYVANSTSHTVSIFSDQLAGITAKPLALVAATRTTAGIKAFSHWRAERNHYFGEDLWRNQGYYQSLWVDQLQAPGGVGGGTVTDADQANHWVPTYPLAGNPECARDADHTYTLTYTAPYDGPMKFWIYDYYYYEAASFGAMSIKLQRIG